MSKQISASELAQVVSQLLTQPEKAGELDGAETFSSFMTAIAEVVCDHCGGEIHNVAGPIEDVWYIGIHGNDSLPNAFGGVWRDLDPEGDLFPNGTAGWFEATFVSEHPDWTKHEWRQEVANCDTKLGYWEWVAHQVEGEASDPYAVDTVSQAHG